MAMVFTIPSDLSTTVKDGIGQAELTARDVWQQYIWHPIRTMDLWDFLDIFLLTMLLYVGYLFVKGRRAGKLAIGFGLIVAFYVISDLAGLRAMHQLMAGIAPFTVILLAIIFQSELRDALEKLGSTPFGFLSMSKDSRDELAHTVNEVVEAACMVAVTEKDGALIVIEGSTALGEYAKNGQPMDAVVSHRLLANIFVDRSPLHDGAVIIRKNRIAAAGCKLPPSSNEMVVGSYGTRHRAAVGVTEKSDCVTVVVSEERHVMSICHNGELKGDYNYSPDDLRNDHNLKLVQNRLRNDLFLLLAGLSFDDNNRNEKPKFKMPSIKLSWGIFTPGQKSNEEPEEVYEMSSTSATESNGGAPVLTQFPRARRYDKRTGQGTTVRRDDPTDGEAKADAEADESEMATEMRAEDSPTVALRAETPDEPSVTGQSESEATGSPEGIGQTPETEPSAAANQAASATPDTVPEA